AEIDHPACFCPRERMLRTVGCSTLSDDLAVVVHGRGCAIAAEGAEIDHPTCFCPRERVVGLIASGGTSSNYLAAGVYRMAKWGHARAAAAEGANIDHPACLGPRDSMGSSKLVGRSTLVNHVAAAFHR